MSDIFEEADELEFEIVTRLAVRCSCLQNVKTH